MADAPHDPDARRMLLEFMRGRDVSCPVCGYNLRDLTNMTCPECEHQLELCVGVQDVRLLPFVMAIAPGIFSGLCALFLGTVMVVSIIANGGRPVGIPWTIVALDLFGWLSGVVAIGLIVGRRRFLAQPAPAQRGIAAVIWTVHVMAFLVLVIAAFG